MKLNFDDFVSRLRENAYANLEVEDYQLDLQGWMDERFEPLLEDITSRRPRPLRILEVGSWKGRSASSLGRIAQRRGDDSFVLCIDTWLGAPEFWTWGIDDPTRGISLKLDNGYPGVFYTFTRNMKVQGLTRQVVPFPISSDQGFEVLRHYGAQFDLIYVDAAHEEMAVCRDLDNAWTVLAPGGILFGDDYNPEAWPGVVAAVNRFAKDHAIQGLADQILWFLPKPDADVSAITPELCLSSSTT